MDKQDRILVIGDLHGALKALQQVLERAGVTAADTLVFLGDYVDAWSDAAALVDFLIFLARENNCIFIKGNHDVWCEQWLDHQPASAVWLIHGGQATADSYKNYNAAEKEEHLRFFKALRNFYVDEKNRLYIHAGFSSMHGPQNEVYSSNYGWDRTLWEMALCLDKSLPKHSLRYPKRLRLFSEIYIGHTPTINLNFPEPMNAANVWNVDTGAAFDGKLSILDVETKQFWQSDPVQHLYPGEKGRNSF